MVFPLKMENTWVVEYVVDHTVCGQRKNFSLTSLIEQFPVMIMAKFE